MVVARGKLAVAATIRVASAVAEVAVPTG
jgi:hypothetical protein